MFRRRSGRASAWLARQLLCQTQAPWMIWWALCLFSRFAFEFGARVFVCTCINNMRIIIIVLNDRRSLRFGFLPAGKAGGVKEETTATSATARVHTFRRAELPSLGYYTIYTIQTTCQ